MSRSSSDEMEQVKRRGRCKISSCRGGEDCLIRGPLKSCWSKPRSTKRYDEAQEQAPPHDAEQNVSVNADDEEQEQAPDDVEQTVRDRADEEALEQAPDEVEQTIRINTDEEEAHEQAPEAKVDEAVQEHLLFCRGGTDCQNRGC